MSLETRRQGREYVAVLTFDAEQLRNIGYALGMDDAGAEEMFNLADELDRFNGVLP